MTVLPAGITFTHTPMSLSPPTVNTLSRSRKGV